MKKNILFIGLAILTLAPCLGRSEEAPRQSMKNGIRFFETQSYDRAAESFDQAAQAAPREKLDIAVAQYNAANARFKVGQFEVAASNFANATRSPNLALQSKAYYNRGNALVNSAEHIEKQGNLDTAIGSLDEAMAMYENAMTLAPLDEDAKVNYELTLKKKQALQQKQQQQQKQKQDQNKKDQQQEDQPKEHQDQKEDQQQKQDQQNHQEQERKEAQQQNHGQPEEPQQQTEDQQPQPQPKKSEEMTAEEAKMMLDAMKQEEQASRDRMRLIIGETMPVDKDW